MVRIRSSTTAFAAMSRRTHGVMRLEGAKFMGTASNSETPLRLRRFLQAAQSGGSTDPFA